MGAGRNTVLGRQKRVDQDWTVLQTEHQASKAYTVRTSLGGGGIKQTPAPAPPNQKEGWRDD